MIPRRSPRDRPRFAVGFAFMFTFMGRRLPRPDLFRLIWAADFPDAESFLRIFHSSLAGSAGNRARYSNARGGRPARPFAARASSPKNASRCCARRRGSSSPTRRGFSSRTAGTHLLVKPYVPRPRPDADGRRHVGRTRVDFHEVSLSAITCSRN